MLFSLYNIYTKILKGGIFMDKLSVKKIAISIVLLCYATYLAANFQQTSKILAWVAMLFSFVGDFSLNYKSLEKRTESDFKIGMLSFMIAHVMYAISYKTKITDEAFSIFNLGFYVSLIIIITIIMSFMVIVKNKNLKSKNLLLGIVYLIIIGLNFCVVCSYSYSVGHYYAAVGISSFLISDLLIGMEKFIEAKFKIRLVWPFYIIGQVLLITMA